MCVSYNGSSNTNDPIIYRNGSSIAITEEFAPSGSRITDAGNNLLIGDVADGDRAYKGVIDDVRIYNRALSPTEIQQLYNLGTVRITQ
jgi:hypothetical protein